MTNQTDEKTVNDNTPCTSDASEAATAAPSHREAPPASSELRPSPSRRDTEHKAGAVEPLQRSAAVVRHLLDGSGSAALDAEETVRVRNRPIQKLATGSLLDVFAECQPPASRSALPRSDLKDNGQLCTAASPSSFVSTPTNGGLECNRGGGGPPPAPAPSALRRSGSGRAHHSHVHHHAHEPSLNDLASLMREQDAELLESLAFRSANDDGGETPRITGASTAIAGASAAEASQGCAIPELALEPSASLEVEPSSSWSALSTVPPTGAAVDGAAYGPGAELPHHHRPTSRRGSTRPTSLRTLLVRHESGGGGHPDDKSVSSAYAPAPDEATVSSAEGGVERSRRALSGEIWVETPVAVPPSSSSRGAPSSFRATEHPARDAIPAADDGTAPPPPLAPASVAPYDAAPSDSAIRRGIVRSESMDRRLNEAAQFAEAVGELRLGEEEELRIIEEDQDLGAYDTDEDDDATEIHVEGDELDHPKPRKVELIVVPMGEVSFQQPPHHPHKVRPQWPFRTQRTKGGFLDKLPENGTTPSQDFVYKGIRSNPPEIVKRGVTRGNYSVLHRKAWLECTDKYHRYGKNLRLYYRFWERLGFPTNMFFDWLDSKGEAAGQPLPELDECPRSQLDSDTVLYITDEKETRGYALDFIVDEATGQARVVDADKELVRTGSDGWIFVLRDNVLYGAQKITSVKGHCKQRFHHSSFFGGKAVAAAGIFITDDDGTLQQVLPHSGHYRPGEAHMQRMLFFLHSQGVDLWSFQVDMQQILHVARDAPVDGSEKTEKKKKIETLRLIPAGLVACYLAHKARFIGEGIFAQIHRIKKADVATVTEALELIDDGSVLGRSSAQHLDTSS